MFWRKRLKNLDETDENKLKNDIDRAGGLEKGDLKAMIIAALTTIVPVCLLVLLVISLLAMWIFGVFG
ncbi:MAG: hypothetical protein SPJ70_04370 [Candidatus Borkfalkiaceae bacterium]|nr:hypothetical protein [Eubacteriales bacterium]MDY5820524.1 hypothetical protein [Christensenellaceae bacterium]